MARIRITVSFIRNLDLSSYEDAEGEKMTETEALEHIVEEIEEGNLMLDEFSEGEALDVTAEVI